VRHNPKPISISGVFVCCSIMKEHHLEPVLKPVKSTALRDRHRSLDAGGKHAGAPDGTFSLDIRAYWPDYTILDGTWTPPSVEEVSRRMLKR
jgi:hypothetical protein